MDSVYSNGVVCHRCHVSMSGLVVLGLALGGPWGMVQPASSAELQYPRILECINGAVELDVVPNVWKIPELGSFHTRSYSYKGKVHIPSPTIRMRAGSKCTIRLRNKLNTTSPVSKCHYHYTFPHCPDTTNLHVHGLHVSSDEDNVFAAVLPGGKRTYKYTIPKNHLMGTHWYHGHYHGATNVQLSGGMAGAILMEPSSTYELPADLQDLYARDGDKVLVMQPVNFNGKSARYGSYLAISGLFRGAPEAYESLPPNPTGKLAENKTDVYLINGLLEPTLTVEAGKVTLLRFLNAGGLKVVELALTDVVDENSTGGKANLVGRCEWRLLARDGVFQYTPYQDMQTAVIFSGSRADIAVLCPDSLVGQTVRVSSGANLTLNSALNVNDLKSRHVQATVFNIAVKAATSSGSAKGDKKTLSAVFPTSQAPLPSYLQDLTGVKAKDLAIGPKRISRIVAQHLEVKCGPTNIHWVNGIPFLGYNDTCHGNMHMHDGEVTNKYLDELCLGETYQYTMLTGPKINETDNSTIPDSPTVARQVHPMHIHVHHQQVVAVLDRPEDTWHDIVRIGEWRDSTPAFTETGAVVRFRPTDFTGDVVLHCHNLLHEDTGMMALLNVRAKCGSRTAS